MKIKLWSISILAALSMTACSQGPNPGKGFRLPEGNPDQGKAAFVSLKCHTCHQVVDVDLPTPIAKGDLSIFLGGEVTKLRTYGDLVTSVINPSHGLSTDLDKKVMGDSKLSPMPEFNETMTVQQMIDLVAFLHPRYKKLEPEPYYTTP